MLKLTVQFLFLCTVILFAGCSSGPKPYYKESPTETRKDNELETIYELKLFDKTISYRNDKKAYIDFTLPKKKLTKSKKIEMVLEAYNDDPKFLRAIWFEVDGMGGYLNAFYIGKGQLRGSATLRPKEQKRWLIDLSKTYVSPKNRSAKKINFSTLLRKPGKHTISCWISTYKQYGPNSWVSINLLLKK